GRYVRLTDRFKSVWTYHQFASAVFKNFLSAPLPYTVDFQSTYDRVKAVSALLNAAQARDAAAAIDLCDLALDRASAPLVRVDDQIGTPILRRFFEELTEKGLLKNARQFKHRLGDFYFHPDILLAIVELNVATKNKFLHLYHEDEKRIVEDSQRLLEHGAALERNFGDTNPELLHEIARFRSAKEQF